jgi:hypothetical protein
LAFRQSEVLTCQCTGIKENEKLLKKTFFFKNKPLQNNLPIEMFFLMVTQWGIELFCFHEQTQFYQVGIAT